MYHVHILANMLAENFQEFYLIICHTAPYLSLSPWKQIIFIMITLFYLNHILEFYYVTQLTNTDNSHYLEFTGQSIWQGRTHKYQQRSS